MKYQNIFKRQTKLTLYIVICLLLLASISSYALFLQINKNKNNQVITAGDLALEVTYQKNETITNSSCFIPLEVIDYNSADRSACKIIIKVKNIGTLAAQYQLTAYNDPNKGAGNYLSHQYIALKHSKGSDSENLSAVNNDISLIGYYTSKGLTINFPSKYYGWEILKNIPIYKQIEGKTGEDANKYNLGTTVLEAGATYYHEIDFWVDEMLVSSDITDQKVQIKVGIDTIVKPGS